MLLLVFQLATRSPEPLLTTAPLRSTARILSKHASMSLSGAANRPSPSSFLKETWGVAAANNKQMN